MRENAVVPHHLDRPMVLLPPVAQQAHHRLTDALAGVLPACAASPEDYFTHDPEQAEAAARACVRCPARRACDEYADALDAPAGVWGGRDRGRLRASTNAATDTSHDLEDRDVIHSASR